MARPVYARIADLRRVLPDETAFPDTTLVELLEISAATVENLTGQFFGPKFLDVLVDGLGKRSVEEAERNKIIEVVSVAYRRADGTHRTVEPRYYSIPDSRRRVRLRSIDKSPSPPDRAFLAGSSIHGMTHGTAVPPGSPARRFPYDDQNVRLQGYFGWLDLGVKFETVLAADIAVGGTTLSIDDTGDLQTDDLLLIDQKFWVLVGSVTLASVDPDPGTVALDPSPGSALSGSPVIRFGRVPLLIKQASIRTALANQYSPGSDEEGELSSAGFIKKEKTDNYEIEFFNRNRSGSSESGTGDAKADAILGRFRAPTVSGEWS